MPSLDVPTPYQSRKNEGRQHHSDLGIENHRALGMPVGHGTAPEGEQQHGEHPDCGHGAQQNLGTGQLIYQPALGRALHPCAGKRHELANEEQPKIPVL